MGDWKEAVELISEFSETEQRYIFDYLRKKFPIHPIEGKLDVSAEVILEAIDRASDLTLRGIRGIIAEAAFKQGIVNRLVGWSDITPPGDGAYDFLLADEKGQVRIQVKMQRLKAHQPMSAKAAYRFLSDDKYVVETQRTRGGKDKASGKDTRPYRFGEFDILAVCMHPSCGRWNNFLYTVANWLIPRPDDLNLLLKFQPVAKTPNDDWTDNSLTCIEWFRSAKKKTIEK
jgi:hypothetical protein